MGLFNIWDIIDNIDVLGIKLSTLIKRSVLVAMVLIPSFGTYMATQCIDRAEASATQESRLLIKPYLASRQHINVVTPARSAPSVPWRDTRFPEPITLGQGTK